MTKAEYESFKANGIIPRGNVLSKSSSSFSDKNLTHYVEFKVNPNILKLKDATRGWYTVILNNRAYQKLYQMKELSMPEAKAIDLYLKIILKK